MRLQEYLLRSAAASPGKVALVCGGARITYAALAAAAGSLAGFLAGAGLAKGDRVVVYLENSAEAVVAIFGILQAGGAIVVVNPATQAKRLATILQNCDAEFVVSARDKAAAVEEAAGVCAAPPRILWAGAGDWAGAIGGEGVCPERHPAPVVQGTDDDLAAIIYTSGSTGAPKGVTMLHRNIDSAVRIVGGYLEHGPEDVILSVLPLAASYGLLQLLVTFSTGGCLVLEKGVGYPYELVQRIKDERITGFAGTPTLFAILLALNGLEKEEFPSLRYLTNAAAALPAAFVPKLRRIFPRTRLYLMHGLSECLRTTYLPPAEVGARPTSVGKGMPGVELWIEDADGNRLGPGQVGELFVRGPTVMQGYWNDPAETAQVLRPGRNAQERVLRTRDLFAMDEEGYFHFIARADELIKCRGEKVSPIEVEDAIYTLDAVHEVRVIGAPDPLLGQAIRAEIVLKEGRRLDAKDVKACCRRLLEDFKVPQFVEFVPALPKTAGGKIKRSG